MKFLSLSLVLFASVMVGCAHGPQAVSAPMAGGETPPPATEAVASYSLEQHPASLQLAKDEAAQPATADEPEEKAEGDADDFDYGTEDVPAAEQVEIADPLEPFKGTGLFLFPELPIVTRVMKICGFQNQ